MAPAHDELETALAAARAEVAELEARLRERKAAVLAPYSAHTSLLEGQVAEARRALEEANRSNAEQHRRLASAERAALARAGKAGWALSPETQSFVRLMALGAVLPLLGTALTRELTTEQFALALVGAPACLVVGWLVGLRRG